MQKSFLILALVGLGIVIFISLLLASSRESYRPRMVALKPVVTEEEEMAEPYILIGDIEQHRLFPIHIPRRERFVKFPIPKRAEPYMPATQEVDYSGSGGRIEGCCGCDRLSSDLTFYCGGSGRSTCRYPIDLPAPDEPAVPDECTLSGACASRTCLDTLKTTLQ